MSVLRKVRGAIAVPFVVLSAANLPTLAHSDILQVTLSGTVTAVDSALSSAFSTGDAFEYGVTLDTDTAFDMWGSSSSWDGTRLHSPQENKNNYFTLGNSYTGTHTGSVQPIFVDKMSSIGPTGQGYSGGMNNFTAPDVNGYPLAEVYLKFGFGVLAFSGVDDPTDVIDATQLKQLSGIEIVNKNSLVAYRTSSGSYHYVRLAITDIHVAADTPSPLQVTYQMQTALSDTDGNGMAEIATLYTDETEHTFVVIRDALSGDEVRTLPSFGQYFTAISLSAVPDMNGNSSQEIAVFGKVNGENATRTLIKDAQTGDDISTVTQ
ncbi:MAG TPA: hypothetical protein DD979_12940 [Gammaproteobacteria bacterium]|jgi:hypothetical protein|nr:hypothetical protein [Gammaproteobacteria bacterium]